MHDNGSELNNYPVIGALQGQEFMMARYKKQALKVNCAKDCIGVNFDKI